MWQIVNTSWSPFVQKRYCDYSDTVCSLVLCPLSQQMVQHELRQDEVFFGDRPNCGLVRWNTKASVTPVLHRADLLGHASLCWQRIMIPKFKWLIVADTKNYRRAFYEASLWGRGRNLGGGGCPLLSFLFESFSPGGFMMPFYSHISNVLSVFF